MAAVRAWLVACMLATLLVGCGSHFDPSHRDGLPALIDTGTGRQLWLATTQVEARTGRGGTIAGLETLRYTHLRLESFDPATAQQLWRKTLQVVAEDDAGSGEIRILGAEAGLVWLWRNDQVVALSAKDASVRADRDRLEDINPSLRGLLPEQRKHYYFVAPGILVVQLADGRYMRISPDDFKLEPYPVVDKDILLNAGSGADTGIEFGRLAGPVDTRDFGVLGGLFDGRWVGLLDDEEARQGEDDRWGEHYLDASSIFEDHGGARRSFRVAKTQTLTNPDGGEFTRIVSLPAIPGAQIWLQGRMLKAVRDPQAPLHVERDGQLVPAPRAPLRLHDPEGVLVLYRTRMDARGRVALARIGPDFKRSLWAGELPFQALAARWEAVPGRLLLYGSWDAAADPDMNDTHEALLSIDLKTGQWRGWDVGTEQALVPTP